MQMYWWLLSVWLASFLPAHTDGAVNIDNDTDTSREEELARIAALPRPGFQSLRVELKQYKTKQLSVVESLTGTQILKNDGKFHLELLAPSVAIQLKGERLNVEMAAKTKLAKEAKLERYLHGQSLEERLAVWGHLANISALINAYTTGQPYAYEPFDIEENDLFDMDIVLDLTDVLQLEEEIQEQIKDGVFPKDKVKVSKQQQNVPKQSTSTHKPTTTTVRTEVTQDVHGLNAGGVTDEAAEKDIPKTRKKRKMRDSGKWSLPIKYKFHNSMSASEQSLIHQGINHWSSLTCIAFSYSPSVRSSQSRIEFKKVIGSGSCGSSYIGKRSYGNANVIEIDRSCFNLGVISHEIGHSLGFYHEHSRPDRDTYVNIHWDNIQTNRYHNFAKRSALTYSIPYDYYSVMHYSSKPWGVLSITAKDDTYTPLMGQRSALSFYDVKLANFHYCANKCYPYRTLAWSSCKNGGYRDPKSCKQCRCPRGYTGTYCTSMDTNVAKCGTSQPVARISTTTQYIQSPSYGSGISNYYKQNDKCSWLIHAPVGGDIEAWFEGPFRIAYSSKCTEDAVEIRHEDLTRVGPRYCGYRTPTTRFTSKNTKLMVLFESTGTTTSSNKGFKMAYKTGGCGLCNFKYSPSNACRHIISYAKSSTSYTRCGFLWWSRCSKKRYSVAYKYQNTCCHGNLAGSQCKVSGCGGCTDKVVKNQPKCGRYAKSRYTREYYTTSCGWWGKRCRRSRVKQTYYWYTPPPCCSGFRLVGNRCIKN